MLSICQRAGCQQSGVAALRRLFFGGALIAMEELLECVETPTVDADLYDYPTPEEEEAAYAIPRRIVQPVQRQELAAERAACVPALWERWHPDRGFRDRSRRSRFSAR